MDLVHIAYITLLFAAAWVSLFYQKNEPRLPIITTLLFISFLTEIAVDILKSTRVNHNPVYHFYIPFEYAMLAYFFSFYFTGKGRKRVLLSIPVVTCLSVVFSLTLKPFHEFPGLQFNLEGLANIALAVQVLLKLAGDTTRIMHLRTAFWICIALVIFHSGLFFFNGYYTYLIGSNSSQAKHMHRLINTNLNYVYYTLLIVGMICSNPNKKYT